MLHGKVCESLLLCGSLLWHVVRVTYDRLDAAAVDEKRGRTRSAHIDHALWDMDDGMGSRWGSDGDSESSEVKRELRKMWQGRDETKVKVTHKTTLIVGFSTCFCGAGGSGELRSSLAGTDSARNGLLGESRWGRSAALPLIRFVRTVGGGVAGLGTTAGARRDGGGDIRPVWPRRSK